MRNLAKEKCPKTTSSITSKPGASFTARRTLFHMFSTSIPLWSVGRTPSRPWMSILKSLRSISNRVVLKRGSSSCALILIPLLTDFLSSVTGSRIKGARNLRSSFRSRFHSRYPMARYSVLAPPSCSAVCAFLKISTALFESCSCGKSTRTRRFANSLRAYSSVIDTPSRWRCISSSWFSEDGEGTADIIIRAPSASLSSNRWGSGQMIRRLAFVAR